MSFKDIAQSFVTARKTAMPLRDFPGEVPGLLDEAYFIQDQAIAQWNRPIIGWKIGRVAPDRQAELGAERVSGPIFQPVLKTWQGEPVHVPLFEHGYAALETEYVFRVGQDTPLGKTSYSETEALALIDGIFAGVEMAGSPLSSLNALGATAVASDFGNNFGLVLGPQIMAFYDGHRNLGEDVQRALRTQTQIGHTTVGQGGLFSLIGGPLKAIGWLAGHLARRNRPLLKGQLISAGATTGIHAIGIGQTARVTFDSPLHTRVEMEIHTHRLESGDPEIN